MKSDLNPAASKYVGDVAKNYDERRKDKPITKADDAFIAKFLDSCEQGAKVLDLPAGTGRAVSAVLDRQLHYIGADISEDMLAVCKQKIGDRSDARTIVVDARSTGLPDDAVDYLISIKFMKWLPDDDFVTDVLKEFRRVCRKSAIVNIKVDKNISLSKKIIGLLRSHSSRPHARFFNEDRFANLCSQAGWTVREVVENPESKGRVKFFVLD